MEIDKNSGQLKDTINSGKAIIITTLQKFPIVYKDIIGEKNNFTIIVDEAHSSQTGEAAKKLKESFADIKNEPKINLVLYLKQKYLFAFSCRCRHFCPSYYAFVINNL